MRWLAVAAILVVLGATGCATTRRLTDDQRKEEASLWVHTPHVAPGDDLELEVVVFDFDDPRVGIERVEVYLDNDPNHARPDMVLKGRGKYWGYTIHPTKGYLIHTTDGSSTDAADSVAITIRVPEGYKDSLPIKLAVHYVSAGQIGDSSATVDEHVRFDFNMPILTPGLRTLRRTLSGVIALGVFALACWALRRKWSRVTTWLTMTEWDDTVFLLLSTGAWGALGYYWFAMRLSIATGWRSLSLDVALTIIWTLAPPLLAYLLTRRERSAGIPRAELRS